MAVSKIDLCSKKGFFADLARNPLFEHITLVVIAFNALWMAIDMDNNDATFIVKATPVFQVVAHAFCLFFTVELSVRFLAFEKKGLFYKDWWFVFDG
eukprot:5171818-Heterocapsa_arctica.AAC.1